MIRLRLKRASTHGFQQMIRHCSMCPGSKRSERDQVEARLHINSQCMWHETTANSSANQIVSCLSRHVPNLPNVTHVLHCSYNCMGENDFFFLFCFSPTYSAICCLSKYPNKNHKGGTWRWMKEKTTVQVQSVP